MGRLETGTNLSTALVSIDMAKLACVCMLLVLGVHIGPGSTLNAASQGSNFEHILVKRDTNGIKKYKASKNKGRMIIKNGKVITSRKSNKGIKRSQKKTKNKIEREPHVRKQERSRKSKPIKNN